MEGWIEGEGDQVDSEIGTDPVFGMSQVRFE